MMRNFSYLLLTAILLMVACESESEAPIITGTVKGSIQITDGYGYNLEDRSGVEIVISSDAYSADTTTDYAGNFRFENVPFGKYQLTCTKENYVQETGHADFGHAGGEVATTVSERLLGIPDFGYTVEFIEKNGCYLNIYVTLNEASKSHAGDYYSAAVFYAENPDVDRDNYDDYTIEYGYYPAGDAWNLAFWCCRSYDEVFSDFDSDSVYCRVYPIAYYHNYSEEELLLQPMGKPSNVFSFENPFNR